MKSKKVICLVLLILMMIVTFNINSYAILSPYLEISSYNYSNGDKMTQNEKKEVEVEETLQLYALMAYGRDFEENPEDFGIFVYETNLSGVTWTSNNNEIATVDNTGKVTGVAEGKATITVTYNGESANYEINVKPKSDDERTGILFGRDEPEPAKILNKEYGFCLYLNNIPDTEKGNIKVSIDNENIAKLIGIDLCNWEDGSGKGMIIANTKLLKVGKTKINATLNYNGKTYSDTLEFDVVESAYSLTISAKEYTDLPSSLEVGDKIQLIVIQHTYGGSILPEDVTTKGVTYISSDEKVAKVDDKGLVTAIGEGTVTIITKYKVGDETISAKYELKVTDSTKSSVNPGNSSEPTSPGSSNSPTTKNDSTIAPTILPQTGKNVTILIFGIIVVISIILYKKYKSYNEIK